MGSTEFQILNLLFRKFGMQVILSFIIAIPISFYVMNNWLEGFAYHVKMGPVIFIMTGLLIGLVTFLTIGYHSMRAAFRNPVNSLRYE
jgi:putative ABC transport system permease protein